MDLMRSSMGEGMGIQNIRLSTGETAAAAGMKVETLKTWKKRYQSFGRFQGKSVEGGGQHGKNYWFSFHNVMEVAVAWKFVNEARVSTDLAVDAAATYAYTGNNSFKGMEAYDIGEPVKWARLPGFPYYDPERPDLATIAFASSEGTSVVAHGYEHNALTYISDLQGKLYPGALVECQSVYFDVCRRLGFVPFDEIEKALAAEAGA